MSDAEMSKEPKAIQQKDILDTLKAYVYFNIKPLSNLVRPQNLGYMTGYFERDT
jgi:hypothetical protein